MLFRQFTLFFFLVRSHKQHHFSFLNLNNNFVCNLTQNEIKMKMSEFVSIKFFPPFFQAQQKQKKKIVCKYNFGKMAWFAIWRIFSPKNEIERIKNVFMNINNKVLIKIKMRNQRSRRHRHRHQVYGNDLRARDQSIDRKH